MKFTDTRLTFEPQDVRLAPMWHHEQHLSYTASGYGSRIPTMYKVFHNAKWRRVYCRVFSNAGTCYIISKGEATIVDFDTP